MKLRNYLKEKFYWSKSSYVLLCSFLFVLFLIGYVWWPLLEDYISYFNPQISIWKQLDWLLIGNFFFMSLFIMLNADLKRDIPFAMIGLIGGFIIEFWGTSSGLWTYYTFEVPPLWIIPAWPIAALSVNRLAMIATTVLRKIPMIVFDVIYWPVFGLFFILLIDFILPTWSHPLTIMSVILCAFLIMTATEKKTALIVLFAGSGLGYFLELWGTTRLCWTYYTGGTPPFFTVVAHGMASIAIWRVYNLFQETLRKTRLNYLIPQKDL